MYAGHFAAAFAIKARQPRVPTWAVLLGVGVLDLLFGIFVPLGIERATVTPGVAPGFRLDFVDWSHSLAMSIVWSIAFALLFFRRGIVIAAWCGFAVFSHFLCDLLMHPHDLALWPHASAHVGFGIWTVHPPFWWFFELAFILLCGAYYLSRARRVGTFGGRGAWAIAIVVFIHVANSPWLSPTR